jgi:single-strand DNA-binding protein
MAGSVNKVILVGRLGADPEVRNAGDTKVANLRVATSVTWKDKRSGEKQEKTEWHSITVWNEATVGFIEQYLSKGDQVYIEGALETRKWTDNDDIERYSTEVVVRPFGGEVVSLASSGGKDGDDRGGSRGGGRGKGRDDDDRGSRRNDDRGRDRDDDRGSSRGGRAKDRDDDRDSRSSRNSRDDDDRGSRNKGDDDRGSSRSDRGSSRSNSKLDDDIPF